MDRAQNSEDARTGATRPAPAGASRPAGSEPSCALKDRVRAFWNRESCDADQAQAEKFSRQYFEQIEQWRYWDQPFIHSFAQFTRYHGQRVLEVGFGAGTDFIQWLRAGARASGIDLTEEALANVRHRIEVYGLPQPESLQVADAENLPFPSNTFDLGYSWGVVHHTPDTQKALAELVRVVRPGGEIKVMLYNRRGLYAWKMWVKHALLKGRPWKSLRWVLSNHVESPGTKGFTDRELERMLAPLGLTDIRMERFITNNDQVVRRGFPYRLGGWAAEALIALTGNRLGWFRGISARKLCGAIGLACALGAMAAQPEGGRFESLGIPVRVGGLMGCVVGPNGRGGEALYFNFNQAGAPLFLVQVDPDTGEARQFTAPQGPGAWAFIAGPDEKIYFGTWDGGLILRFDPRRPEKGIEVVGKPSPDETYLWQFALGKDGKLYACTYPRAKLVSFDPATGRMEDLGRMHPTEMYARSLAVGPNGKVYVGIGTTRGDLVEYDPATRAHRSILPAGLHGAPTWSTVAVTRRSDGNVYAAFGTNLLRVADESVTPVRDAPDLPPLKLRDGRLVTRFDRGSFALRDARGGRVVERTFKYSGAGDMIFVVGIGPGGAVYGSTALPMEIFRFDPRAGRSEHLGGMPGGEVYSLLEHDRKLYLCYYGGAVMNLYDPAKPFWKFGTGADCNPISFGGVGDGHLRPRAMIRGPGGLIYIGSEPPYGQLGGALAVWDPRQNRTLENYRDVVTNQSIVSLAYEPASGLIFGGSGNWGGGGTRPAEKEARFFAFDPKQKRKVFEAAIVPGASSYPATAAADGKVFTTAGDRLLVFDPQTMRAVRTNSLPGPQAQISLGQHRSGLLVGLTSQAVYAFDPARGEVVHTAAAPAHIGCGFALTDEAVYFGSGPTLWRYWLPPARQEGSER